MAKISTYPSADNPLLLSDRLIGTEAIRPIPSSTPLATKNFSLGDLLQLFSGNFPAATLQAVLDAGNIATQNITLTGTIDTTLIRPDNIEDTSGSQGLTFQFLSKGTSSINWVDLPINNLQTVLNAGNTATQNITLIGNITSTLVIPNNIKDELGLIGITGQILSKTATGVKWINAASSTTPSLGDVLFVNNTAINNINLTGNVTATSFIKTGGTILQYLMADGSVSLGPTIVQLLTEQTIDSYVGSRLRPTNPLSNGFYVDRNVNGAVGFTAINQNTGNGAISIIDVGIGALYTQTAYIAKFSPNYYVPLLAGKGGLLGTEEVFVGSTDGNDVSILTGPAFASISRKFTVKADGQLLLQTTPTTGTTSDFVLLRDTSGNVKQIAYPTPAYTNYVCNFNATGIGAPAVSILENTLGNIVWTRNAVGDYRGTLSGAFPTIPKVWFSKPNTQYDAGNYGAFLSYISANVVQLLTTDYDQITPIDGAYSTSFEIRVYP